MDVNSLSQRILGGEGGIESPIEHLSNLERKHKLGAVVELKKNKLEQLGMPTAS